MSLLWAVPPIAVAVGMLIVMAQLRTMADTADALGLQLRRLDEVRVAVAEVRSEAAQLRATGRSLNRR